MKHVFIIGSRGYHENYGGWETFVTNLVDNYNDKNTNFYISKITTKNENMIDVNSNIKILPIKVKNEGSFNMFLYSVRSINEVIEYIKENNINESYLYILGLKSLNYLSLKRNSLKKLGVTIIVNPDGLEFKRSKWGMIAKTFFLLSEHFMLKSSDIIVCDSLGIKDYVALKYPKLKNRTTYIAYGSNTFDFNNINEEEILNEYKLKKDDYCLMVGRCVPENNYELVIKGFMDSNIKKELVVISNINSSNYFNELVLKTKCLTDKRIKFINGVYDQNKLAVIRKNAYLYIHGHSVGGTNPSLIEALSLTDLNVLYDVDFNKYAGSDSCLYCKDKNTLKEILDDSKMLDKIRSEKGKMAKDIVKNNFTWDIIIDKYKKIFK